MEQPQLCNQEKSPKQFGRCRALLQGQLAVCPPQLLHSPEQVRMRHRWRAWPKDPWCEYGRWVRDTKHGHRSFNGEWQPCPCHPLCSQCSFRVILSPAQELHGCAVDRWACVTMGGHPHFNTCWQPRHCPPLCSQVSFRVFSRENTAQWIDDVHGQVGISHQERPCSFQHMMATMSFSPSVFSLFVLSLERRQPGSEDPLLRGCLTDEARLRVPLARTPTGAITPKAVSKTTAE